MIKFPENFYFGSSISAEQSEGRVQGDGKALTTWDELYRQNPNLFFDKVGPEKTSRMYTHYIDDVKLLKETGHTAYRTSISWARLIPNDDGIVNEKAYTFYRDYFKRVKDEGITLMVNLFHFDMPLYLQEKYEGFVSKEVVNKYAEYAKKCFELFGDLVSVWFTFNEPIVSVECGYFRKCHYPMEENYRHAVQVAYNMQLASSMAVRELKKIDTSAKIGIILNLTPAYPRSNDKDDLLASKNANLLFCQSFLDPSVKGYYDKDLVKIIEENDLMPEYTEDELDIIKNNTVNILGINYYQPLRVKKGETVNTLLDKYFNNYDMPNKRINPYRGWEIYPQGLYDIAMNIKNNYGNIEWLVTETGMGVQDEHRFLKDGIIHDDYRIEFFKEHLEQLHKGMSEGSNCKGFLVWTFIDCWSWLNAYKNRYGLVSLDYDTEKRTIKKSGHWFKELSRNKGF